ncbi:Dihydropteroate synthase [Acaryochloris thomasi RCC1774]|uniref:Dihydropteroate synthase n=1 Tax=Acaryochloris thomasi RCC1774 TaxID=1764569 RepID=A0A2W1JDV4_9CYAN|nr:dihydropteroate synthase [Acaryochloris thomasi]PZD71916.1 Dihydropteroate synthase [Acaryochloris thomasi RCC1774]
MTALKPWVLRDRNFIWGQRTYLMGILNVTPDSFSDGGQFNSVEAALKQAKDLAAVVDIIDIGGQSTRPQAVEIDLKTELERVIPVVEAVRKELTIPISIDTTRAEVARVAIASGADLINDVSGGTYDSQMFATAAQLKVPIILMHLRGTSQTMQQLTDYNDLLSDISKALEQQIAAAVEAGVDRSAIALDPGIGFAKTGPQNIEILRRLQDFQRLGCPILVGPSRKSFIGHILDKDSPQERVWGTAAACCSAIAGRADILRIHDGAEIADVCRVADAIWRTSPEESLLQ